MDIWFILGSLAEKFCQTEMTWCEMIWTPLISNWPLIAVAIWGILVARGTLQNIQRQIEIQISGERGWILADPGIIPDDFEPNPNVIAFLEIRPLIRNYGKTPARITKFGISQDTIPAKGKLPPEPNYKYEQMADIILPPDQPIQPLKILLDQKIFIDVRRGDPTLYVFGYIEYMDLGDTPRKSRFCFVYYVPSGFTSLKRGFYIPGDVPAAYTKCI